MRADLLKWKVVLVAGLVAVGLGLVNTSPSGNRYADLVLCAIPFATAYVDLLCRQLHLRIQVIGRFRLKAKGGEYHEYEQFAEQAGNAKAFSLDSVALIGASIVVCVALIVLPQLLEPRLPHATAITISGIVGIALALMVELGWRHVSRKVGKIAVEFPGSSPNDAGTATST